MGITRDLVEYDRNIQYVPFKVPKTGVLDTDDWGGVDYNDPDAIGANPVAKIYPDGTIVGSTDNGDYVKYPNGELKVIGTISTNASLTSLVFPIEFIDKKYSAVGNSTSASSATVVAVKFSSRTTSEVNVAVTTGSFQVSIVGYILSGRWKL